MSALPPSKDRSNFWISCTNKEIKRRNPPTERCGKWLLFVPLAEIDAAWAKVEADIKLGNLSFSAKTSTAKRNPNAVDPNIKVICVYTPDSEYIEDVRRVRERLRVLGFNQKIPYKTDVATLQGCYQVNGSQRISSYYE
jgi:hypothetical protein